MSEPAVSVPFVEEVRPQGILSFAPDSEPISLRPLNVLIGPNGAGKSNFVELFELVKSLPTDFAGEIRGGGGVDEWLWKGPASEQVAKLAFHFRVARLPEALSYGIAFTSRRERAELVRESLRDDRRDHYFFDGHVGTLFRHSDPPADVSFLEPDAHQSIFSQRKDSDVYPELTALGQALSRIVTYREWSTGPFVAVRGPQPADLPNDVLLPDARNLGLILNLMSVERTDAWEQLNEALRRFLPSFKRLSVYVAAGTVQLFLHEDGLRTPTPAARISDGTLRFIALLAVLLRPDVSPLICLEEPELGLHPDALRIVAELLVGASRRTQIVVTTQSDALVSALSDAVGSVVVCDRVNGATQLHRLNSDKLSFWLEKYQLGELWRMGELGGNP